MDPLKEFHKILTEVSREERRAMLEIIREDPSLLTGFVKRLTLKREEKWDEVLRIEEKEANEFMTRLKINLLKDIAS